MRAVTGNKEFNNDGQTRNFIFIYLFINAYSTSAEGLLVLQPCLELFHKVCLKGWRKEKKSMTGPGHP